MLKAIRKFLSAEPPVMSFPTTIFIPSEEACLEDVVQQIYDTKKFCRWVNFFPFVWVHFKGKYTDVGCTGRFFFFLTPFSYKITFSEVIPNKRYKAKVSGLINGEISGEFIKTEDGIIFEHPFTFTAANNLVHVYYNLFIKARHLPYMEWRYKLLKENAMKDAQKRKQGGITYGA
ncbi:MAG: hypothetical protein K0Q99_647 [Clostridia bacterium]|jgi:hypothetical protein|nr:hypothetical protein [Clostridia bacterium]